MKIPIVRAEKRLPVGEVVRPSGLLAQAGASQQVQGLINSIVEEQGRILEKQKAINQATEISQAEIDVENENQKLIENLKRSPNPERYYSDWQAGYQNISKNRLAQIKDPETKTRAQITFQKMMAQNMVQQSHYGNMLWLSTKRGQIARLGDEYIKNGQPEKAIKLIEDGILGGLYTPEEGEKEIIGIKDKAEAKEKTDNYANALNMIMIDPTEETLNKAIKLFDIPTEKQPDLRRQQRIERDAQERQKKEIETLAHDDKEREVEKLIRKGKLNEAFVASGSNLLKADEQAKWRKDIETVSKQSDDKINPDVENAEIVRINRLISYKADPNKIRREILISEMTRENKEQRLINLETKLVHEMDEGKRRGYQDIQDIIIPPKVGLSLTNLVQSPKATIAIKNAQMALDDWIQNQIINKKEPSINEIRIKAQQLAQSFAIPMSEAMIDLERAAEAAAEEMKKYGEEKLKRKKEK